MFSRRNFLRVGGAAVCAGIASTAFGKSPIFPAPPGVPGFSSNGFQPLVNSYFKFRSESSNISASLKLVEVKDLVYPVHQARNIKLDGFSLLFEGTDDLDLTQDFYQISQSAYGEFSGLVVPVTNERKYYEIIFNNWRT